MASDPWTDGGESSVWRVGRAPAGIARRGMRGRRIGGGRGASAGPRGHGGYAGPRRRCAARRVPFAGRGTARLSRERISARRDSAGGICLGSSQRSGYQEGTGPCCGICSPGVLGVCAPAADLPRRSHRGLPGGPAHRRGCWRCRAPCRGAWSEPRRRRPISVAEAAGGGRTAPPDPMRLRPAGQSASTPIRLRLLRIRASS